MSERYMRQICLDGIGLEGQQRLHNAKVLIVGVGGLGCPAAQYLAAAGVGTIGLADNDNVELTNLQRQPIFSTSDIGKSKVVAAKAFLEKLNPQIRIIVHNTKLEKSNSKKIVSAYDIVLDGTDNFSSKYLLSDICHSLKKQLVYASVYQWHGQLSVFPAHGPCYRCLLPKPPPKNMQPSCSEGGIVGTTAGIIGVLQAQEAIKLILKKGRPLEGKLLVFDGLQNEFKELKISKRSCCKT